MRSSSFAAALAGVVLAATAAAAAPLDDLLAMPTVDGSRQLADTQAFLEARIPRMPPVAAREPWDALATTLREDVLRRVCFRGEAAAWRDAVCRTVYLDEVAGAAGYRIRKLRYEPLPGLWIPAVLYVPERTGDKVPVMLAVDGHEPVGKAADYKQARCITLAKRGMLVLSVDWFGMGQLRTDGFGHGRLNLVDLCGSSGLAPFFLSLSRGIDVLLAQPHADPERVAVSGVSGGGWQTIMIASLDPRVTLANPVAGYSSFLTRIRHHSDLGDSEQTPCDLATVVDYTHLTAMMAPRATLLTYNAKDNCCFASGHALEPLLDAARPVFRAHGAEDRLRFHVHQDPGDHNFGRDNREALYRMIGESFFAGEAFDAVEAPCDDEIRTAEELTVPMPAENLDFQKIALSLARQLPRDPPPAGGQGQGAAEEWQARSRRRLAEVLRLPRYAATVEELEKRSADGVAARGLALKIGADWVVPAVELTRGEPVETVIVLHDGGRKGAADRVAELLAEGNRVVAVDLWGFGEAALPSRSYLFNLMMGTVGERPLGIQTAQLIAVARAVGPARLVAIGPRTSVIALCAAALCEDVQAVELHACMGTLREVIEMNRSYESAPELFCFGLFEATDLPHLARLVAPRPVALRGPTERARREFAGLRAWYAEFGRDTDPLR